MPMRSRPTSSLERALRLDQRRQVVLASRTRRPPARRRSPAPGRRPGSPSPTATSRTPRCRAAPRPSRARRRTRSCPRRGSPTRTRRRSRRRRGTASRSRGSRAGRRAVGGAPRPEAYGSPLLIPISPAYGSWPRAEVRGGGDGHVAHCDTEVAGRSRWWGATRGGDGLGRIRAAALDHRPARESGAGSRQSLGSPRAASSTSRTTNKAPGFSSSNAGRLQLRELRHGVPGQFAFVGGFNGVQIFDISNPANAAPAHGDRVPGRPG